MIVFPGRKPIDIFVGIKLNRAFLRLAQLLGHLCAIHILFQTEIYAALFGRIQKVVALILRIVHPKLLLDVFGERVNLKREIAAIHRVEKIKPDGKLGSETCMHGFAEKFVRMLKDQIDRWDLHFNIAKAKQRLFSSGTQSKHHA